MIAPGIAPAITPGIAPGTGITVPGITVGIVIGIVVGNTVAPFTPPLTAIGIAAACNGRGAALDTGKDICVGSFSGVDVGRCSCAAIGACSGSWAGACNGTPTGCAGNVTTGSPRRTGRAAGRPAEPNAGHGVGDDVSEGPGGTREAYSNVAQCAPPELLHCTLLHARRANLPPSRTQLVLNCLRLFDKNRFLTAELVRPGRNLAILLHWLPSVWWHWIIIKSSSSRHGCCTGKTTSGSRKKIHRSRHCLPSRPAKPSATCAQFTW
mmetsp:Transcript_89185/g.254618  ORF Transcript_89185/g.254618 Transcript_89185/m.254618 type:complete len:266 (-) Transcript_89185:181-978(-)